MTEPAVSDVPGVATPKTAAWEDALDIYYAPRQVFERRRDGKYLVMLLILCALTLAIYFLSIQFNEAVADAEFTRSMAKQTPQLTAEQMASARAFAEKIKSAIVYFIPFGITIGVWISGAIVMLLGKMMGGKLNFAQGTTIVILASMPELLGKVFVGAQGLFLDTAQVASKYSFATSVSRFLPADTNSILLKLGAVADPFVIWGAVLLGLGVFVIGRMEKEKAAVLAIIHTLLMAMLIR